MKTSVVIGAFVALVSITTSCLAAEFRMPYSVKKEMFLKEMKKLGYDFYGNDDSDGNVQDKGSMFIVFTNLPPTEYTMEKIEEVSKRCIRV